MTGSSEGRPLGPVFFPYATRRTAEAISQGGRFVYYTNAAVATSILQKEEIWLRNATVMNDFREISHGRECLRVALKGPAGEVLQSALNSTFPSLYEEVGKMFDDWSPFFWSDTYLMCVSEHPAEEDRRGRLSMWRAYGGRTGVALVFNGGPMFSASDVLGVQSSPVFYGDPPAFAEEFTKAAVAIAAELPLLVELGRDAARNALFNVLRFAVLCTKHPGFSEEREWRIIGSPLLRASPRLLSKVELVRGVPQLVAKIKLENAPAQGLVGLALPELLDRIIIGPCDFPLVTHRAFYSLLSDLGVPDPQDKIIVSDIPLRHYA